MQYPGEENEDSLVVTLLTYSVSQILMSLIAPSISMFSPILGPLCYIMLVLLQALESSSEEQQQIEPGRFSSDPEESFPDELSDTDSFSDSEVIKYFDSANLFHLLFIPF